MSRGAIIRFPPGAEACAGRHWRSGQTNAGEKAAQPGSPSSLPENRWPGSTSNCRLLPNVLVKQQARRRGRRKPGTWTGMAWSLKAAPATPGSSRRTAGSSRARPTMPSCAGVTRTGADRSAQAAESHLEERSFSGGSPEVGRGLHHLGIEFGHSGGAIDGRPVGDGQPGPVATALRAAFHEVTEMSRPVLHGP